MKTFQAGGCWQFSEGLAAVYIKNRWGYIDKQGNIAIKPQYTDAYGFSEGLAAVIVDKKYGFIDKTGAVVLQPKYDFATAFTEGVAIVLTGNCFQIIDKKGTIVTNLDERFSDVEGFSCGLAAVEVDEKYGFIDQSGKIVIEPRFNYVSQFEDGIALATLTDGGKNGYIDTSGRFVMEPQFDEAEYFSEGVAPVKKNSHWHFMDRTGKEVVLLNDSYEYVDSLVEGRARVLIGGKYGAIDKMGNLIVDARFDDLHFFSEDLTYARIGNIHGFINPSGVFEIRKPVTKPTLLDILCGRKNHLRW